MVHQFAACTERVASKGEIGVAGQSVGHKLQKGPQVQVTRQPPTSSFNLPLEPFPLREPLPQCVQK
ncbi:hypothetical protein FBZ84_14011 [Azospirillum baldaniorum]|nr:hypothetical protein FBZ84_14011 [Azospirillum baldaniorum]